MPPASQVREVSLLHVRACFTPFFGGSLAADGWEVADPVCTVGGAGCLLVSPALLVDVSLDGGQGCAAAGRGEGMAAVTIGAVPDTVIGVAELSGPAATVVL